MTFAPIHIPGDLYFVTGSIVEWESLFINKVYANTILASLHWHRLNQRMSIFAFVLMSNHIHWISKPVDPFTINDNIKSFASFTAHQILKTSRLLKHYDLQILFRENAIKGKHHRIWRNFQAKNIYSQNFLIQKLEYIHNNPLNKGGLLSDSRSRYMYSSAGYYDKGQAPLIPIDDIYEYIENLKG